MLIQNQFATGRPHRQMGRCRLRHHTHRRRRRDRVRIAPGRGVRPLSSVLSCISLSCLFFSIIHPLSVRAPTLTAVLQRILYYTHRTHQVHPPHHRGPRQCGADARCQNRRAAYGAYA
jgi:hypothetical protein